MAEVSVTRQALQQLEDQLTCPVCFNVFKKARLLSCAHEFCQDCIQRLVRPGTSVVTCPCCCKETVLPQGGVTALQQAFRINGLTEIQSTLEKVEEVDPVPSAPFIRDPVSSVPVDLCPMHSRELEFYCETCSIVICAYCTVKQHHAHQYRPKQDGVASSMEVQEELLQLQRKLNELNHCSERIVEQRLSLEAKVDLVMESSLKELKSRKASLINELYSSAQEKLTKIAAMKKPILNMQDELNGCTRVHQLTSAEMEDTKAKIVACVEKMSQLKLDQTHEQDLFINLTQDIGQEKENFRIYATGLGLTTAQVSSYNMEAYVQGQE